MLDWSEIIKILSNLGALIFIGKWIVRSIDKSNENLPVIIQSIKTLTDNVKELFDSRNEHALAIKEIKTGIDHCPSCNEYKHQRVGDIRPTLTQTRKSSR